MQKLHFLVNNFRWICQRFVNQISAAQSDEPNVVIRHQAGDELEEVVGRIVKELELKKENERK